MTEKTLEVILKEQEAYRQAAPSPPPVPEAPKRDWLTLDEVLQRQPQAVPTPQPQAPPAPQQMALPSYSPYGMPSPASPGYQTMETMGQSVATLTPAVPVVPISTSVTPQGRQRFPVEDVPIIGPVISTGLEAVYNVVSPQGAVAERGKERDFIGATAAGIYEGVGHVASLAHRSQWDSPTANAILQNVSDYEQSLAEGDVGAQGFLAKTYRGALSSLITSTTGAVAGGVPGAILFANALEMNSAIQEGQKVGLSGEDLAMYTIRAGLIEATPATVMQALGMGGFEKILGGLRKSGVSKEAANTATRGVMAALKQLGVSTIQEVPEEIVTGIGHNLNTGLSNVDPSLLTAEKMFDTALNTTAQTVMTMGIVNARNLARGAAQSSSDAKFRHDLGRAKDILFGLKDKPLEEQLNTAFGKDKVKPVRSEEEMVAGVPPSRYSVDVGLGHQAEVEVSPVEKPTTPEEMARYLDSVRNEHFGDASMMEVLDNPQVALEDKFERAWAQYPATGGWVTLPNGAQTDVAGLIKLANPQPGMVFNHETIHGALRLFTTDKEFETVTEAAKRNGAFSEEGLVNTLLLRGALEHGKATDKGVLGILNRATMRMKGFVKKLYGGEKSFDEIARELFEGTITQREVVANPATRNARLREMEGYTPQETQAQAAPAPAAPAEAPQGPTLSEEIAAAQRAEMMGEGPGIPPAGPIVTGPDMRMPQMGQGARAQGPVTQEVIPEPVTQGVTFARRPVAELAKSLPTAIQQHVPPAFQEQVHGLVTGALTATEETHRRRRWEAVTPRGDVRVSGEYQIVDADDLITSNMEGYDQSLQARNRDTITSQAQIKSIAGNPDPTRLMDSPTTDLGAPLVDESGQVISGNGRTMGLREAYATGRAEAYRKAVEAKARRHGLSTEGIANPVLVRVMLDTGGASVKQVADLSNQNQILQMTTAEQAQADAEAIGPFIELFQTDEAGNIRAASNRSFLTNFVQATHSDSLLNSDGSFSSEIDNRVKRAMLARVFKNSEAGRRAVQNVFENAEALGMKRILDGVTQAAGRIVTVSEMKPQLDLTPSLGKALHEYAVYRQKVADGEVKLLDEYLGQGDMFQEGQDPLVDTLIRELDSRGRRSATALFSLLDRYGKLAEKVDLDTPDMFTGEVDRTTPQELLNRARQELETESAERTAERANARREGRVSGTPGPYAQTGENVARPANAPAGEGNYTDTQGEVGDTQYSTLSPEMEAERDLLLKRAGGDATRAWKIYERMVSAAATRGEPVDPRLADTMRRALLGTGEQADLFGEAAPQKERRTFTRPAERPVQQSLEGLDDGMLFSTAKDVTNTAPMIRDFLKTKATNATLEEWAEAHDKWNDALTKWVDTSPDMIQFVNDNKTGVSIVSKDSYPGREGKWRVSWFSKREDNNEWLPTGHVQFESKIEAVKEAQATGRHDSGMLFSTAKEGAQWNPADAYLKDDSKNFYPEDTRTFPKPTYRPQDVGKNFRIEKRPMMSKSRPWIVAEQMPRGEWITDKTSNTEDYLGAAERRGMFKTAKEAEQWIADHEGTMRYSTITDTDLINELESGEKIKVFRGMQLIDGKLYPPMSAKVEGKLRAPTEIGKWEQADENPELIGPDGKYPLDKANKSSKIPVDYNPYFHTSTSPLNDQWASASTRDNLVTVEVEIPKTELTSGYRAKKAVKPVGYAQWPRGPVDKQLSPPKQRKVILSRYAKVTRIVPDSEVADILAKTFEGEGVTVPEERITPSLRQELEKRGVPIKSATIRGATRYSTAQTDTPEFKRWFGDSKVVDENGAPLEVYHGTDSEEQFYTFAHSKDLGYHFGLEEQANQRLIDRSWDNRSRNRNPRMISAYLSIKNPIILNVDPFTDTRMSFGEIADSFESESYINLEVKRLAKEADEAMQGFEDIRDTSDLPEKERFWNALKKNLIDEGYDGVIYENRFEGKGRSYVVFSPEQIKSSAETTYDNQGNVIPQERRYDPTNEDMRYSTANLDGLSKPQRDRYTDAAFAAMYQYGGDEEAYREALRSQFGAQIDPYVDDLREMYLNRRREGIKRAQAAAMQGEEPVGRPDLANFGETPEAKKMLSQTDEARNEAGKPDHIPRDVTRDKAETMIGQDREGTIAALMAKGMRQEPLTPEETRAGTILFNELAQEAIDTGDLKAHERAQEFADALRESRGAWGRAGVEMQVPKTPEEKANMLLQYAMSPSHKLQAQIDKTNRRLKDKMATGAASAAAEKRMAVLRGKQAKQVQKRLDWLKRLGYDLTPKGLDAILGNEKLLARFMADVSTDRSSLADKAHELRISNMLSWVTTHQRNILSAVAHQALDTYVQRALEATVNSLPIIGGHADAAQFGEFGPILVRSIQALPGGPLFKTALKNAMRAYSMETQQLQQQVLGETLTDKVFESARLDSWRGPAIKGRKGRAIRTPLRSLLFEDELLKTIYASIEVGAQAHRIAKAEKTSGKKRKDRMRELVNDPTSDAWKAAYKTAERLMFQDSTGGEAEKRLMQARNIPTGRWVIPFAKTPMAVFRTAVRKAGGAGVAMISDYMEKQPGDVKMRHAAETILAIVGATTLYAMLGGDDDDDLPWVTGANPRHGSRWAYSTEAYEIPKNSFRIDNTYYDYTNFGPLGDVVSFMVTGIEAMGAVRNADDVPKVATKAWGAFMREFVRHPMLTGVTDFVDAMEDENQWIRFWQNFAGSFVPNIIKGPVRAMDPAMRDKNDMTVPEGFAYAAYPSGEGMPAKIDVWGKAILKGGSTENRMFNIFRPVKEVASPDSIEGKLNRLIRTWNANHPDDRFAPRGPVSRSITEEGQTYELTAEQFETYRRRSGRYAVEILQKSELNFSRPQQKDVDAVDKALRDGRKRAREEMLSKLQKKAS